MSLKHLIAIVSLLGISSAADAGETHYQYDALGRLKQAQQSAPADPPTTRFTYDPAGNRTQQVVENSTNGSAAGVIVTPMGTGFAVIPFDRQ